MLLDLPPAYPIEVAGLLLQEVADHRPAGVGERVLQLAPAQQHLLHRRGGRLISLVPAGAVLVEAHDEWQTGDRRYLAEGSMAQINPPRRPPPPANS
ncbi:hypothetical protein [Micromonospora rhizosphaerae]|uniref:hypothetical protein n=1 Tax=Micromonospora rhizosphaerae TaxID=568872 RepID=UPI001FDED02B|nr:hypothetical protein [Micromonospora rhizosphaerae]